MPRELLTPQQHYDWGLRALKTVLKACGSLLQYQRRSQEKDKSKSLQLFLVQPFCDTPPHTSPLSDQHKQKEESLNYCSFFFFFKLH